MKKCSGNMQGDFDMEYDIFRNGSGYVDTTAFKAIRNYLKREEKNMELYSGDIFKGRMNSGGERIFVILSVHDRYSTVLMLCDNENLPIAISCAGMKYTDPGQIQYIFNDNLIDFIRSMTKPEFDDLMQAVVDSLGYEAPVKEVVKEVTPEFIPPASDDTPFDNALCEELTKVKAERDVYKSLYENLIRSMIGK